jgi:hypothetical protein
MDFTDGRHGRAIRAPDLNTERYRRYTLTLLKEVRQRVEHAASDRTTIEDVETALVACDTLQTFLRLLKERHLN